MNDNSPRFDRVPGREVYFDENQQAKSKVFRIKARDADSGENGYISYSIANLEPVPFEIDQFSGVLNSTRLIDYESDRRMYKLRIRASDWGTPYRRQSEMRLTVKIRDINDNRPQFERINCVGKIPRGIRPGSNIFTLSALDFDSGNVISYRVVSGNADGCFSLDSSKGVISVVCDLRTLPITTREINVTATDGQHFSDVTPIVIEIVDSGDAFTSNANFNNLIYSDYSSSFQCEETNVAKQLTDTIKMAAQNNIPRDDDSEPDVDVFPSRFGSNIHRPEFDLLFPKELKVNETAPIGTLLMTVRQNIIYHDIYIIIRHQDSQ